MLLPLLEIIVCHSAGRDILGHCLEENGTPADVGCPLAQEIGKLEL
jgi:hypothetical protein